MNRFRFKCSDETVKNIYLLFDKLAENKGFLQEVLKETNELRLSKGFYGNCSIGIKGDSVKLPDDILSNLNAQGLFDGDNNFSDIFMLRELYLNFGYFFKQSDILRCSEDYGIVGDRKHYSNMDVVFAPKSSYNFRNIAEVRDEYSSIIQNGYRKAPLPENFRRFFNNNSYRKFFKELINKGYTVNSLFERGGDIFCRNRVMGYKCLDYLEDVEYSFYNELLELVVDLRKPVHRVYFYSDLDWSCILYRESKEAKDEFEIVLK